MFEVKEYYPLEQTSVLETKLGGQGSFEAFIETKECDICNEKIELSQFEAMCECSHEFCQDCLKYYCLHKIKNEFCYIECPKSDCTAKLKKNSPTFINLPADLRFRYERIVINLEQISNPSFRICPHCEEVQLNEIKADPDNLFCKKCLKRYCKKCMNPHGKYAKCDNYIIGLLKRGFKFKKCTNCSFIVEKNEGCNHMTCKCKYEFCYLCGGDWNKGNHKCPPVPSIPVFRPVSIQPVREKVQRQIFPLAEKNIIFQLSVLNPEEKVKSQKKNLKPIGHLKRMARLRTPEEKTEKQQYSILIKGSENLKI